MSESIAQPTELLRLPQRSQIFEVPDCQAGATFQSCYNKLDKFKVALLLKSLHPLLFGFGLMAWLLFVASKDIPESLRLDPISFQICEITPNDSGSTKLRSGAWRKKIRILNLNWCSFCDNRKVDSLAIFHFGEATKLGRFAL